MLSLKALHRPASRWTSRLPLSKALRKVMIHLISLFFILHASSEQSNELISSVFAALYN
jgi:hypothetical protein